MKTMTCKQLGGACEREFHAETFEEMAQLSKAHAMVMMQQQDEAHLAAMRNMEALMKDPQAMERWFESKKNEFNRL